MIKHYIISLLCMFILSCSTMPIDTLNKKLATFEIAYGQVLQTVGLLIKTEKLTGDNKKRVQDLITEISKYRTAIYIAKGYNDLSQAENNLVKAQTAFKLIGQIVSTLNKQTLLNLRNHYYAECINSFAIT